MEVYNIDEHNRVYNSVKEIVLVQLVNEGLLEPHVADEFAERCHIMVYKPKWFERLFKKEKGIKMNDLYFRIVELKSRESDVEKLKRKPFNDD